MSVYTLLFSDKAESVFYHSVDGVKFGFVAFFISERTVFHF